MVTKNSKGDKNKLFQQIQVWSVKEQNVFAVTSQFLFLIALILLDNMRTVAELILD